MAYSLIHTQFGAPRDGVWWALGFSVVAHLSLIALTFTAPEAERRQLPRSELELVLVNAQTHDAPLDAKVLAQVNLNGGGRTDAGRTTTVLAPSLWSRSGDAIEETQAQLSQLEHEQALLLSDLQRQLHELDARDRKQAGEDQGAQAREKQRQALAKLMAQIERRIEMEGARPKRVFAQVSARQSPAAIYFDRMRQTIESQGTQRFPMHAGQRLYGHLTLKITVSHRGQVLSVDVLEPSGQSTLDAQAVRLTRQLTFGTFDPALRQQADQLVVVTTYSYLRDNQLVTETSRLP